MYDNGGALLIVFRLEQFSNALEDIILKDSGKVRISNDLQSLNAEKAISVIPEGITTWDWLPLYFSKVDPRTSKGLWFSRRTFF